MKKHSLKHLSKKLIDFVKDRERMFGEVNLTFDQLSAYGLKTPKDISVVKESLYPNQIVDEIDIKDMILDTVNEVANFKVRYNVPFTISDGRNIVGFILRKNAKSTTLLPCDKHDKHQCDKWVSGRTKYYFALV